VSLKGVEAATCHWTGHKAEIVSLRPHGLQDALRDIRRVAAALDAGSEGEALINRMRDRLAALRSKTANLSRPGVAFIEWMDPLMSGGNWMPTLISAAGGRDLLGVEDAHSPVLSWESLANADPDVIVIAPCGFPIDRTVREMPVLESHERWAQLKAVRSRRVYIGDGNAYFNRPGPRLVETAESSQKCFTHPSSISGIKVGGGEGGGGSGNELDGAGPRRHVSATGSRLLIVQRVAVSIHAPRELRRLL
jgi:iron complex transport system substrate-binding protein